MKRQRGCTAWDPPRSVAVECAVFQDLCSLELCLAVRGEERAVEPEATQKACNGSQMWGTHYVSLGVQSRSDVGRLEGLKGKAAESLLLPSFSQSMCWVPGVGR